MASHFRVKGKILKVTYLSFSQLLSTLFHPLLFLMLSPANVNKHPGSHSRGSQACAGSSVELVSWDLHAFFPQAIHIFNLKWQHTSSQTLFLSVPSFSYYLPLTFTYLS